MTKSPKSSKITITTKGVSITLIRYFTFIIHNVNNIIYGMDNALNLGVGNKHTFLNMFWFVYFVSRLPVCTRAKE